MRAVLTNFGSTGDILPFVALAQELRRHGHHPVLALPPSFEPLARAQGVPFTPVGPDLSHAQDDITRQMMVSPDRIGEGDHLQSLFTPLATGLPRMLEDLRAACAGADVLISGRVQPAARMVHDLTRIPMVSVYVEHSGSGGGHPAFLEAVRRLINPVRQNAGLPPFHNPLVDGESPQLVLYAMSQHVRPPPRDLPGHHHMVGYFYLEGDALAWSPPAALKDFGRILSERLKDLEIEGIVKRDVYPETPVRIEYSLTEKGKALAPVMNEIQNWAQEWLEPI